MRGLMISVTLFVVPIASRLAVNVPPNAVRGVAVPLPEDRGQHWALWLLEWARYNRHVLERFELGDVAHRVTTGFSHGMGRRLSVCLAALHEPEVLLLDEPFDGVDPLGVDATIDEGKRRLKKGD